MRIFVITTAVLCLTTAAAMAYEPMAAAIRVSSGSVYDYVLIGEDSRASDGFDNAYDTISPGNLNADMGQPYISALIVHPEWNMAMKEFRGDVRSVARRQEWAVSVSSSLPKGTPLTVELQEDRSSLPKGMRVTLKDRARKKERNVAQERYLLPAPGPGAKSEFTLVVEQP
ncbi:hypothetical protein LPW11_05915 [Geomonas sp. RF6]|uniref:hypothetical protein n=1 Tax=Geomonas sp. RF6 TaxID=2897342 RepID=UPI001E3A9321|nr:hypothetical protein [Geomonas sp. RF6]UFS71727.1 hypothetical protein LPW11_05915 [Geomonas sp. RF6]